MSHLFQIFGLMTLRYFVIAGVPFLLFYIFFPSKVQRFRIQQRVAAKKDFIREIWQSMQSTLVFTIIAFIVLYTPVKHYTQVYDHINSHPVWYIAVSLVLSLIVHDTYFYWMHRIMHHKALFKIFHLVHHKSVTPSPWTSYSFHFLEAIVEGSILFVLVLIMPMHAVTVGLFTVSAFIINVYGHLGYETMPLWFRRSVLFEFVNTSLHHNLHHSKFKGNYGLYFRVWDRVMGTEHPDYVKEYDRVQAQRLRK